MNLLDYIDKDAADNEAIFIYPNIPENKKQNAHNFICPNLSINDEILVLIDDSVFLSAKVGIVITHHHIYFKKRFDNFNSQMLKNIKNTFVNKHFLADSEIFINGEQVYTFDTANKGKVEKIFQGLMRYISALQTQDAQNDEKEVDTLSKQGNVVNQTSLKEISLLKILDSDSIIEELRMLKVVDTGLNAAAVAADLFSNFVLKIDTNFSYKRNDQEVKDEVKKTIIKITLSIRNNVDRLDIRGLQNDTATIEFMLFASALIFQEVVDRGYPESGAFEIIRMTLFDFFKQNTRYFIPIMKDICSQSDSQESIILYFIIRLYFTNYTDTTLDYNFIEQLDTDAVMMEITEYALKKGFYKEINPSNLYESVMKCINREGIIDIVDDDIIDEAYRCVDKLCE